MDALARVIAVVAFLAVLSQAVQKATDLAKSRSEWLNHEQPIPAEEGKRQFWIYVIAFAFGTLFSGLSGFTPHLYLSGSQSLFLATDPALPQIWAAPVVGLAVAFGGNIWNEILGILREVKKEREAITASMPLTLAGLTPGHAKPGDLITINGPTFGSSMTTAKVTFDRQPMSDLVITSWTPTQIQFRVPPKAADGTAWPAAPASVRVYVGILVADQASINTLPLDVSG